MPQGKALCEQQNTLNPICSTTLSSSKEKIAKNLIELTFLTFHCLSQSFKRFITTWLIFNTHHAFLVSFCFLLFFLHKMRNITGFHFLLWVPPLSRYQPVSGNSFPLAASFCSGFAAGTSDTLWDTWAGLIFFKWQLQKYRFYIIRWTPSIFKISSWKFLESQNS